jgi:uncharacterized protein YqgC (DUF456 family)
MLVGAVGSVVPVLPGTPVVLAAAIVHRLIFGAAGVHWWVLMIMALLTAISYLVDYAAGMVGAKKLGATWRGVVGAALGGLIGLFFSIPGILLGPFIGATVGELLGGRELKPAAKAGLGAFLGLLAGAVGKLSICVAMMLLFAVDVIWRSVS